MQSMYVGINIYGRNEILNEVRVRQAMLYSVDLDGMWGTIAGGFGTKLDCQIVAPGGFGYNSDVQTYPYDPAKAKELLAEAGYPDGFTITGSATSGRYFRDRTFMEALAAQWAQVGIIVEMEYPESSVWLQELIDQTLPPIMNIGLNWYLAYNTTSMWGPVGRNLSGSRVPGNDGRQARHRRPGRARGRSQRYRRLHLRQRTGPARIHDPSPVCAQPQPARNWPSASRLKS